MSTANKITDVNPFMVEFLCYSPDEFLGKELWEIGLFKDKEECMHCKMIRGDEGAWTQLELYIKEHTEADFSHGICGPCAKKMYPEIYEKLHLNGDKKE